MGPGGRAGGCGSTQKKRHMSYLIYRAPRGLFLHLGIPISLRNGRIIAITPWPLNPNAARSTRWYRIGGSLYSRWIPPRIVPDMAAMPIGSVAFRFCTISRRPRRLAHLLRIIPPYRRIWANYPARGPNSQLPQWSSPSYYMWNVSGINFMLLARIRKSRQIFRGKRRAAKQETARLRRGIFQSVVVLREWMLRKEYPAHREAPTPQAEKIRPHKRIRPPKRVRKPKRSRPTISKRPLPSLKGIVRCRRMRKLHRRSPPPLGLPPRIYGLPPRFRFKRNPLQFLDVSRGYLPNQYCRG